jgi:hypothetical protein
MIGYAFNENYMSGTGSDFEDPYFKTSPTLTTVKEEYDKTSPTLTTVKEEYDDDDDDDSRKRPRPPPSIPPSIPGVEKFPNGVKLNVTFKRDPTPNIDLNAPDDSRKVRYHITKFIDSNRDLYFVKLVSGALKRRSFHSLIDVESTIDMAENKRYNPTGVDVKVKYTYNVQLLHAWATVIEKIKDMIDPMVISSDQAWNQTESLHVRIIEKDGLVLAFARYVAYIMMTESNYLVPRNKTRYVLNDQATIEDQRVSELMRAVKRDLGVLKPDLEEAYLR